MFEAAMATVASISTAAVSARSLASAKRSGLRAQAPKPAKASRAFSVVAAARPTWYYSWLRTAAMESGNVVECVFSVYDPSD